MCKEKLGPEKGAGGQVQRSRSAPDPGTSQQRQEDVLTASSGSRLLSLFIRWSFGAHSTPESVSMIYPCPAGWQTGSHRLRHLYRLTQAELGLETPQSPHFCCCRLFLGVCSGPLCESAQRHTDEAGSLKGWPLSRANRGRPQNHTSHWGLELMDPSLALGKGGEDLKIKVTQ